ncbi:hypothetical protein [Methylobacterium nigriterrae]|uniref:hypothetical protein n=1 Tax=Methylobacterium nigriterrae TaxID=3127512 RepID=UPI003013BD50
MADVVSGAMLADQMPSYDPPLSLVAREPVSGAQGSATIEILSVAKAAGVTFSERLADGELIAHGSEDLCLDLRAALEAQRGSIRSVLLPAGSTASVALLERLGVELIFIDDEQQAAREVGRLCAVADTLGLDVETAPRPEFLPVLRPIAITKDGRSAKTQPALDTSAALDPFRAEVRLLQVAGEIEGRTVALVIDLRRVPLGSDALAPIWKCTLVGHNLSFDAKMLMANGIALDSANLLDTILMSGLILRGVADRRREGTRRASLKAAVDEALGIELPKESQVSPWWRDRLTDEQVAYAALDAVFALKLADALLPRIGPLARGRESLSRLCEAVVPVVRMELAGITLDRDELARQADSWEEELIGLKAEIAGIGIANPSTAC